MKFFIKTYGCALNQRDGEYIAGTLKKAKHKIVGSIRQADAVVVNSCGVKSKTEAKVISFINSIPKAKKVYVGGCLPRMLDITKQTRSINGIFDTNTISQLPDIVEHGGKWFSNAKENKLNKPIVRKNKDIAIIPIAEGCLGNCAYCSVKLARGQLKSYRAEEIIREVKKAVKENCSKIFLTAQDTGCYGEDIGSSLPELLNEILKIKGDYRIRIGMMNPNQLLPISKEMLAVYKDEKIMKFLHVPVQSGSDRVLKEMNRNYKAADFKRIVKAFRGELPSIRIATDIIVGYPSETDKDFKKTLELVKAVKPDVLNMSKFAPRHGTQAKRMRQTGTDAIKRRSVQLAGLFKELRNAK